MPTTYNGIGTHYYGRKNISQRKGACPHCNREVDLKSYDTRLWFVLFFIPVIPLGRKRILDYCPACTRHHVVELQKWEMAKQLEISGAEEEYRKNPTPEGAVALHQHLCRFHQHAEAEALQRTMAEKYTDNARVQAYLGATLEHFGKADAATTYYQRALSLRPDLPEARIGVAMAEIRAGRLEEARRLLDFLEKPGAAQLYSLEPLETLALGYQKAGQHKAALELFARLQAELPKLAEVKAFREMVKRSEKGLDAKDSILPKQKFSWRRLFSLQGGRQPAGRSLMVLGILAGLVALGFVIANEYIRRHRTLYVVNGFPQPVTVEVAGAGAVPHLRSVGQLSLGEGRYHAKISGAVNQELDFEVRSGYFSRWFGDPAWVINVGGAAPLILERVTYSKNPPPASYSFHFGNVFETFPDVTHPFTELPETLQMKSHESRVLTHLDIYHGNADSVFSYLDQQHNPARAFQFAETYLRAHPADRDLLQRYATAAHKQKQNDRLDGFLKSGLTNRPVVIEWHRVYQALHQNRRDQAQLIAEYDAQLQTEPTNSALLYLRGRIDPDRAHSRQLLQRAAETDPRNPYACFALGYDRMAAGDWQAARTLIARAVELAPSHAGFANNFFLVRLANGEATALQEEARKQLRNDSLDSYSQIHLLYSLAVQGQREAVLQECAAFERHWMKETRSRAMADVLNRLAWYAVGDFAELEKRSATDRSPEGRLALAQALIEQHRVNEALQLDLKESSVEEKPFWLLAVSLALAEAGDKTAAAQWRQNAITELESGSEDFRFAATLLSQSALPRRSDLDDLALPPMAKALVLAVLAQIHPESAAELGAPARRFNIEPRFPYYLIKRVTTGAQASVEHQ